MNLRFSRSAPYRLLMPKLFTTQLVINQCVNLFIQFFFKFR